MSFSMLAFQSGCSPSCSASRVAQGVALKFSKLYVKLEPDAIGPLNSIFPIHAISTARTVSRTPFNNKRATFHVLRIIWQTSIDHMI